MFHVCETCVKDRTVNVFGFLGEEHHSRWRQSAVREKNFSRRFSSIEMRPVVPTVSSQATRLHLSCFLFILLLVTISKETDKDEDSTGVTISLSLAACPTSLLPAISEWPGSHTMLVLQFHVHSATRAHQSMFTQHVSYLSSYFSVVFSQEYTTSSLSGAPYEEEVLHSAGQT